MFLYRGPSRAGLTTRPRARLLAVVLAAVAGLLVTAAPAAGPAHAADAGALVLDVPSEVNATPKYSLQYQKRQDLLRVEAGRSGGAVKEVRITVDTGDRSAKLTAPGLGQKGGNESPFSWTLPLGDGNGPVTRSLGLLFDNQFVFNPHTLHITASADGLAPVTRDVAVTAVDYGPALQLAEIAPATAKPGDALTVGPAFRNSGNAPAPKVVLTFTAAEGLAPAETFSNCEYATFPEGAPPAEGRRAARHAICTFDRSVESDEVYAVSPFVLNTTAAADSAWARITVDAKESAEAVNWRSGHRFQQGTGHPLELDRIDGVKQEHLGPVQTFRVASGTADLTVEASWHPTAPDNPTGDLTVTFKNLGPDPFVDDPLHPHGVNMAFGGGLQFLAGTVSERPDNCTPKGDSEFNNHGEWCAMPRSLDVGEKAGFTLRVLGAEEPQAPVYTFPPSLKLVLGPDPATVGPEPFVIEKPEPQAPEPQAPEPAATDEPPAADVPPAAAPAPQAVSAPPAAAPPAPAAHGIRLRWKAAGFLAVLGAVGALLLVARRRRRNGQSR
ncbi:hypothetical protein ACFQ6N_34955 [Kitasatospora sp. NPDC056446]|uniref:hypothetical protein n=1 Tax=Kitasatospora sp. NPDC056446 TaxID=3345819 RepID=UPI00367F6C5A